MADVEDREELLAVCDRVIARLMDLVNGELADVSTGEFLDALILREYLRTGDLAHLRFLREMESLRAARAYSMLEESQNA